MTNFEQYRVLYRLGAETKEESVMGIEKFQERIRQLQLNPQVREMSYQTAGWVNCDDKGNVLWNGRF